MTDSEKDARAYAKAMGKPYHGWHDDLDGDGIKLHLSPLGAFVMSVPYGFHKNTSCKEMKSDVE